MRSLSSTIRNKILFITAILFALVTSSLYAQTGNIIEFGDQVLDPNQDGYISTTNTGFSTDGYDVDEFEIKMFGIPIFGDGEALKDIQAGEPCGVSDLSLDTAGYALYAGLDASNNLIFRFRVAGDKPSVQSYSILMDTDQLMGNEDPNSNSVNPGFEIEITLIQNFGVYIYAIDGSESCPTPLEAYDVATHEQKATSSLESCNDPDIYIDFYVPFSALETHFGITVDTDVRMAGVTNISATCALDGKISDIGGVDDTAYNGCFSCAILDLAENQCPSSVSNLCDTCAGFPLGVTGTPSINLPVLVGDTHISGTADPEAEIYIDLFSGAGALLEQDTVMSDLLGDWISNDFANPLTFEDSVIVNAKLPSRCESGFSNSGLSFAIVSPNQPPQITGSTSTLSYMENSPPLVVVGDLSITDDNTEMVSASVSISSNYQLGADLITATTVAGITMSFSEADGTLSFTGTASINDYIQVLQSVTFENISDNPDFNVRVISFTVNDGINQSPVFDRHILLEPINDPPQIIIGGPSADTLFVSTMEDIPLEVCLTGSDAEGDSLAISSMVIKNGNGTVSTISNLCFLFDPAENYTGIEYVEVEVCDNGTPALCDNAVVAVEVTPVNDPPSILVDGQVVDSLFYKIIRTESLSFCLTATDIENNAVHFEQSTNLGSTTSTLTWQTPLCFTYNAQQDFIGVDEFQLVFCDNGSPSKCTTVYVQIEVTESNSAPVIAADTLFVDLLENNTAQVCVTATDPDSDPLSFGTIEELLGVGGSVTTSYPCLDYTPPLNFVGTDRYKVMVCDNLANPLCDSVIIEFNVQQFNNPPEVIDNNVPVDSVYVNTKVNTPLEFCLELFDPDNDNVVITAAEVNASTPFGTIVINGDQCLIYNPPTDYVGDVTVDVTICDNGDPTKCTDVVIIIDVLPQNEAPLILDGEGNPTDSLFYYTQVNTAFSFCLDTHDPDGDSVMIGNIETITGGGIYTPQSTPLCINFNPNQDYIGEDIHRVTVCDNGSPAACSSVIIKTEVVQANSPPVFLDGGGQPADTILLSTNENVPIDFCLTAQDPDGDNMLLDTYELVSGDGVLQTIAGNLCFRYSPAFNYFGNAWVTVSVCDDNTPSLCADLVVGIEVINVNQKPEILFNGELADTLWYSTPARTQLNTCVEATDKDGNTVSISSIVNNEVGSSSTIGSTDLLCFEYTPGNDFLGTELFTLTVCDDGDPSLCDTTIVAIEVYTINTTPGIQLNGFLVDTVYVTVTEGDLATVELGVTDAELDGLQINDTTILTGSGQLDAALDGFLTINYRPEVGTSGKHLVRVTVCDDGLPVLCNSVFVDYNVLRINTAPNAVDDRYRVNKNEVLRGNVLDNDTDNEEDSLVVNVSLTVGPEYGSVELRPTGEFAYTPPQEYLDSAVFIYTVCDYFTPSMCSSAEVTIEIVQSLIPDQALSPNDDGLNDFWYIQGIEHYPNNSIKIFDRWNNQVYSIEGYNNHDVVWRGEANKGLMKKLLDDGTYYYLIIPGDGGEKLSGMVIIKR